MIFLAACAATTDSAAVMPASEASSLGAGDVFEVRVYQEPDLSGVYRVAPDGTINFPLLGAVPVAGKTTNQVALDLERRLRDGYINHPQVSLFVKEYNSKKIFVLGQVMRPGAFAFSDGMSIVNAIADAGGFTRTASPNKTSVTRVLDGHETKLSVAAGDIGTGASKNFTLSPGDIIYVPESLL